MATRQALYSLYLTRFVGNLGFVAILTLLPVYVDALDPSGLALGLFVSGLAIGRTVAGIPVGWAADRYDKRAVLLASLLVIGASFAAFGVVSTTAGLVGARTLQGLGSVGVGMISLALVGDLATEGTRANAIGRYNAWRLAAGILGALGVGAAYDRVGLDPIFWVLVALAGLSIAAVWLFVDPDETRVSGVAYLDLAVNRRILTLTSFRAQYAVAVTLVQTWIPIYVGVAASRGGLGLAAAAVGAVVAAEKVTNMLLQPYSGTLSDRYGRALFVLVGGGAYGLLAFVVPATPAIGRVVPLSLSVPALGTFPPVFLVALALNGLFGVADSLREPASMALFADEGKGSGITSSFGIRGLVWRPGAILAPILGGVVMSTYGIEWVFYAGGAAALSGVAALAGILVWQFGANALSEW
jgi:MFS family permease